MVNSYWMSAVLGLHYLKQGLECFCDDVVKQRHARLIRTVMDVYPQDYACTECNIKTLIPAHAHVENRCPLGQINCNCKEINKAGRDFRECPKGICGIIYDQIIKDHGSTPPSPNWMNTDIKEWYTDPWAIATCSIKTGGYAGRKYAAEFDCSGLLSVIIYNKTFLGHLRCDIDGDDSFSKAVKIRNDLFHSSTYNIEEKVAHEYINVMIDALNLLVFYGDASKHVAIQKLNALKKMGSGNTVDVEVENDQKAIEYLMISAESERPLKKMGSSNEVNVEAENDQKAIPYLNSAESEQDTDQEITEEIESDKNEEECKIKMSTVISILQDVLSINKIEEGNTISDLKDALGKDDTKSARASIQRLLSQVDATEPNQTKPEMPTISRPYDGRLITLNKEQVRDLIANCDCFIQGGFGKVHITKTEVPGLDIRVVIKKIVPDGEGPSTQMLSTSNEKIASRVMHFAIVPLIAYMEESLEEAKRGIIVHKDLTSMNIVLDYALNARIIDFGLAREMNEGQSKQTKTTAKFYGTIGYYQTTQYSSLTVHEDYYNFGIVIRELLTGIEPYIEEDGGEKSELRKHEEYMIERMTQENIWILTNHINSLATLSTECLKSREKNLGSASIVERLKQMHTRQMESTRPGEDRCKICMVNEAVSGVHTPPHRCRMKVFVSCMRNSHINPIKCSQCNECVEPEIGHTFAALLIAGSDKNADLAKSFKEDVEEIKQVLVSKCPCIIGIREENVITVTPSDPGTSNFFLVYRKK